MVRFVEKPSDVPTWVIKKHNFGRFIPNLFLDMLEIKEKVKPGAPLVPDSTYQGNAFTEEEPEPPLPEGGPAPEVEDTHKITLVVEDELESHTHDNGTRSDEEEDDYNNDEIEILNRFGDNSEEHHHEEEESHKYVTHESEEVMSAPEPIYIPPPTQSKVREEDDQEDVYAREVVEKRMLLEYFKENKIDYEETDSLRILREIKKAKEKNESRKGALTLNRALLGVLMWGSSEGLEWWDDSLKGFLQYQMKLMHLYDGVLEEFDDVEIAQMIMDLPPFAKLTLGVAGSSALFVGMKKFGIEDKLRTSKFMETIIPGYGKAIDSVTKASEEVKRENGEPLSQKPTRRKRRGPSLKPDEIRKMM